MKVDVVFVRVEAELAFQSATVLPREVKGPLGFIGTSRQRSHAFYVVRWWDRQRIANAGAQHSRNRHPARRPGFCPVFEKYGSFDERQIHGLAVFRTPTLGRARAAIGAPFDHAFTAFEWLGVRPHAGSGGDPAHELPMGDGGIGDGCWFRCGRRWGVGGPAAGECKRPSGGDHRLTVWA